MPGKAPLFSTMLILAGLAASTAIANGIVISKRGVIRSITATHVPPVASSDTGDAGLVSIFDNFSKYPKSRYWGWIAAAVNGAHDGLGDPELWTAAPFTPATNATVTKIRVAATWYSGTNGIVVGLYNDASGIPGAAIKTWQLSNLPSSLCCTIDAVKDSAGIPLTGGTQYWIALSTSGSESSTDAGWDLSETDQVDTATLAQYCSDDAGGSCSQSGLANDAWTSFGSIYNVAFEVLGTN